MKRCFVWITVLILIFLSPAWAGTLKLGVVDIQTVMEKSDPGKAALKKLNDDFGEMKAELDLLKKDIEKLHRKIMKQSLVLDQEANKVDKKIEYKQSVREFQDLRQSYRKKMRLKERKLINPILEKLQKVIDEYGSRYDYSLVLSEKNSGVIYWQTTIDITDEIIAEFNKNWTR